MELVNSETDWVSSVPIHGKRIEFLSPNTTMSVSILNQVMISEGALAFLPKPRFCVDVGACIGAWSVVAAAAWPEAEILAIEPSTFHLPYLLRNVAQFPQIKVLNMAASSSRGTLRIALPSHKVRLAEHWNKDNTGMISVYGDLPQYAEDVQADTLDAILGDRGDRRVDFLKIDVEGHELEVLRGARRLIRKDEPFAMVETSDINMRMAGESGARVLYNHMYRSVYKLAMLLGNDAVFMPRKCALQVLA